MSQHRFETHIRTGQKVEVTIGYDRPLNGFFLVVTDLSQDQNADDGAEEDVFVYSNLDDVDLSALGGLTLDLDYFKHKLEQLGITLPTTIEYEVQEDRRQRVGNRVRLYDSTGLSLSHSQG